MSKDVMNAAEFHNKHKKVTLNQFKPQAILNYYFFYKPKFHKMIFRYQ